MDHIRDLVGRITELSDDELKDLKNSIVSEFKTTDKQDDSREVVDTINELAEAADALTSETTRREVEAAQLRESREAATARVAGLTEAAATAAPVDPTVDDDSAGPDAEDAGDEIDPVTGKKRKKVAEDAVPAAAPAAPVAVASVDDVAEPATAPETEFDVVEADVPEHKEEVEDVAIEADNAGEPEVVESDESVEEVSVEDTKKEEDPEDNVTAAGNAQELEAPADRQLKVESAAPVTITAGANIPEFPAGSDLNGIMDVAKALVSRQRKMGTTNPGADGEQITVATFRTTYPADRTLVSGEQDANSEKVAAVISPQALVAGGGLCAPVTVSYDIFGFGVQDRPVRDALPTFAADRGGITFVTPPTLADLNGAVSLWTVQDDIDAATAGAPDPVKPCIRVNCGTQVTVYTDAIPLCLTFGNLNSRAWPELVARHTELGLISQARYAETRLLTRIGALSTSVSAASQLGAARDFFVAVDQAAAAYRSRHRLAADATLRALLPDWFRDAIRADLTKQLPGDGQEVTFNLSDATIDGYFRARDVEPSWFLDGETGQIFGTQSAGALNAFPSTVIWYLFAEGTFLFLDGGTLDLGLVRDSTLNGTNDYKIFLEAFEGVAKVGIESLRISSQLGIWGSSSATTDIDPN